MSDRKVHFGYDWDLTLFSVSIDASADALTVLKGVQEGIGLTHDALEAYVAKLKARLEQDLSMCAERPGWSLWIVTRNTEENVRSLLREVVRIDDTLFQIISEPSREHNKAELIRMRAGDDARGAVFILVDDSGKELDQAAAQAQTWGTQLHKFRVAKPNRGAQYSSGAYGLMNQADVLAKLDLLLSTLRMDADRS